MAHKQREPRSPYARYNKRPFRYSDELRELERIVKQHGTNDTERGLELRIAHARKFGYPEPGKSNPKDWA